MTKKISRREATKMISLATGSLLANPSMGLDKRETMNKRLIPSTGEEIPIVGLGTWQSFDVGQSAEERAPLMEVLKSLVAHGGSVIDSSPMYGRSEKVVGDLSTSLGIKHHLFEATKVWISGKDAGIRQMNSSFHKMAVQKMDLMQVHNLLDWQTHLRTLRKWKDEEKIRYIGITHYHSGAYSEMERIMKSEPLDFIQVNYNLAVRGAGKRILPLAMDKGIAVLINRPYEGGSLFRKFGKDELPPWAAEFGAQTWGQFFLKFILGHPAVTCVIPGTSKAKHMTDNALAGFGAFPDKEMQRKMIEFVEK